MSMIFKEKAKPLPISKEQVWSAYKKVKSNKGSYGVDKIDFTSFDEKLSNNLYKLWSRLASGSYFPPSVRSVTIAKSNGKTRELGIPTIGDRICQQVLKDLLEPILEPVFSDASYGYRPLKSAHQALKEVESNTRNYDWVIDLDISKFFDHVNHEKLLLALDKHVEENWIKMYIKRWLEAPIQKPNGELIAKTGKGTPQGGVISPLLANLYLHYTLDIWLERNFPKTPFVRYADDIVIHCKNQAEADLILAQLKERLAACNLSLNEEKTKVVYCKNYKRKEKGHLVKFEFLGFSFKPKSLKGKAGKIFLGFGGSLSKQSYSKLVKQIRDTRFHKWTTASFQDIANLLNPKIMGWINYYEKFKRYSLSIVFHRLHNRLVKWLMNKHKSFKGSRVKACNYLRRIHRDYSYLFYHWRKGYALV